jgi:hypothetical protein
VERVKTEWLEGGSGLKGTTGPDLRGKRNLGVAGVPRYLSVVSVHQGGWHPRTIMIGIVRPGVRLISY